VAGAPGSGTGTAESRALGVGMLRPGEDLLPGCHLDDLAAIHDCDKMRHVLDDARSWLMKSSARPNSCCRSCKQVDDLRLDGDVESRDRLVADDQFGFRRECPCDADTLALTA